MDVPNTTYLDSIAGNDEMFRNRFISILKTEFPQEFEEYRLKHDARSFEETANIVHKIKHKLNICGMQDAYRLAVDYEEELKKERDEHHKEFLSLLTVVDEFIKNL